MHLAFIPIIADNGIYQNEGHTKNSRNLKAPVRGVQTGASNNEGIKYD